MFLGIDHLVIAVPDPDGAADALSAELGLRPAGGGRHEALGTFNRLVWLGDTYLELIGVFDDKLAREAWVGRPTLAVLRSGPGMGLATWAIASDDIDADLDRLKTGRSDIGFAQAGQRLRPDGRLVTWRLAAPASLGHSDPPFLIQHDPESAEWTAEDRAGRATDRARLVALEIEVDHVAHTTDRFLRTNGLQFRPSLMGGGARDANVGDQVVRIRPAGPVGGPNATIRITIPGAATRQTDMLGCRWVVGS
jgi:Glyoxalase-like domain